MALNIGELTGFLDLDAGPFEKGIGKAFDMMGDKKWQVAGAAAGVAAATALAGGLLKAIDTEAAVNKMSAQLGLTKEESAKAGSIAGKLYADNYGESMDDVTEATSAVMSSIKGMREASEDDVVALTGTMMSLAEAMDVDVAEAASSVGQLMKNGLAADATQAMDMIAGAMQKVPAAARAEILPIMDEYGKHFAALGIDGETAFGIISASSADGAIGMDKMGDALKEFTIRGTDMSKTTSEVYDSLGLSTEEMTASLLAGGDQAESAMAKIVGGLSSIEDPGAQAAAAIALFGTPLEDLGTNAIPDFLGMVDPLGDAFDDTAGAAGRLDETLNSGAGAAMKTFTRTAEQTLSDLGATILPVLTPILAQLSEWAPVIGPLVLALGAFAAIMWVVNAAMALSPITWIILGVVALVAAIVLLVMNWDTVVAFLKTTWDGFVVWFTGVMDGFFGWWNGIWGTFFSNTTGMFSDFTTNTLGMLSDFTTNTMGMFADFFTNTGGMFVDFFTNTVGMFVDFFTNTVGMFADFGTNAAIKVAQLWLDISNKFQTGVDTAVDWVKGLPGKALEALGNLATLLLPAGGQILQGFLDGLTAGFEKVKNFVGGIGQWIADNKGPKAYDLALLVPAGGWIMDGRDKGIQASMPSLLNTLGDVSWMIANGIDPQVTGSGSYAFSGIDASSAGTSAGTTPTVTAVLSDEDRALLQAVADRPINASVKVGQRDFALAVQEADKFAKRG